MPMIEIDEKLIPEGHEVTGECRLPREIKGDDGRPTWELWVGENGRAWSGPSAFPRVILRRKRQLDHVILSVTGPKRSIQPGEYFLNNYDEVCLRPFATDPTVAEFIPLSHPKKVMI